MVRQLALAVNNPPSLSQLRDMEARRQFEADARAALIEGAGDVQGLEGHKAEKAAEYAAISVMASRMGFYDDRLSRWAMSLPKGEEVTIAFASEPLGADIDCIIAILNAIKLRYQASSGPNSQAEKIDRTALQTKKHVTDALIKGDEERNQPSIHPALAAKLGDIASKSKLAQRFGAFRIPSNRWTYSLPDGNEASIVFSKQPELADVECVIELMTVLQARFAAAST